ncbi:MAG: DUF2283 domain-containing protein [Candidatus Pacebacteria bacterium]|nr:DUF2283 domain-containing protein [Candidatus Paceibacterota bacterium]
MKITYDKLADAMYIYFRKGKIKKTVEMNRNFIADMDTKGNVLGLEILNASSQLPKNQIAKSIKTGIPLVPALAR